MPNFSRPNYALLFALLFANVCHAGTAFSMNKWRASAPDFKLQLLGVLIQEAKKHNEIIKLPPEYYVKELDQLVLNSIANGDEAGLDNPMMLSFKTIAIMDCDFSNGHNPYEYAKSFFGEDNLESMKAIYPEKFNRLAGGCK